MHSPIQDPAHPPVSSTRERIAGFALFFVVTGCWCVGAVVHPSVHQVIVWGLSVASVVVTGYLIGDVVLSLWLIFVPGVALIATGIGMSHTPPDNDGAGALTYLLGPALVVFGWLFFLPLIGLGIVLRRYGLFDESAD